MTRRTAMSENSGLPFPPFELANRVMALPGGDREAFRDYETQGREAREALFGLLPPDFDFAGSRVLDFGCGAGRTLRQFIPEAESAEIWGVDIDERSVDWINENLNPPLRAKTCAVDPPLDFETGSFDLIWAVSVFTHLSENSADWLLELHRLLRPGGLLMATYMGEWNSEEIAGETWDPDRIGMNRLFHDRPWDQGGPMVLMSDWWVEEHWGRAFEIVASNPWVRNQHWLMMRRRDVEITAEELLAPGSDPREWVALRHNVTQLQREIESSRQEAGERADSLVREYENTLSWRMTRPVRDLVARLRSRRDRQ